jgi:hypothetical protein
MNLLRLKKPAKKNIRDVIRDDRAIKKAAKESINDQKKITQQATALRTQRAQ